MAIATSGAVTADTAGKQETAHSSLGRRFLAHLAAAITRVIEECRNVELGPSLACVILVMVYWLSSRAIYPLERAASVMLTLSGSAVAVILLRARIVTVEHWVGILLSSLIAVVGPGYALPCVASLLVMLLLPERCILGITLAVIALLDIMSAYVPLYYRTLGALSTAISLFAPSSDLVLGPTFSLVKPGLWAILTIALCAIRTGIRRLHIVVACAVLLIIVGHVWWLDSYRGPEMAERTLNSLVFPVVLISLVVTLGLPKLTGRILSRTRSVLVLAGAFLLAVVGVLVSLQSIPAHRVNGVSVLVLNEGGLDWERPVFSKLGYYDGGMFGMLPLYLEKDGFHLETCTSADIANGAIERARILVLINCNKKWSDTERASVASYMKRGGSVLILGDHTNVFNLMEGFNTLLTEHGIGFRFDSAVHAKRTWNGCIRTSLSGFNRCGELQLDHGIGASLRVTGDVNVVAEGDFAFSDAGDQRNEMGAYLGDYRYSRGEQLGNSVLVAWKMIGRGKLVVYGDTSAFQNSSLPTTYPRHLLPLFCWLSEPPTLLESAPGMVTICVVVVLCGGLLCVTRAVAVGGAIGLMGGLLCGALCAPDIRPLITQDHVVYDASLMPWTGHASVNMNHVFPLTKNLMRSGLLPIELKSYTPQEVRNARAIVIMAPQVVIGSELVRGLISYMTEGGVVLVAGPGKKPEIAKALTDELGLDVSDSPLGAIPRQSDRDITGPRFVEAYPVNIRNAVPGKCDVLYSYGDYPLVVFRHVGKGGLLLFSDPRYFSSQNIEGEWGFWPGNLALLHDIFVEYLACAPPLAIETFASPVKPR